LHAFEPQPGQCIFIPAGTVHALGAGLLVAEIQQASDTTYRLYDWNRVGTDGKPRPLHIEAGLAATDFSAVEVEPQQPQDLPRPGLSRLVACDKFVLERWMGPGELAMGGDDRFHLITVISGTMRLSGTEERRELPQGHTILLPACSSAVSVQAEEPATLLHMYVT